MKAVTNSILLLMLIAAPMRAGAGDSISWQSWGPEAFASARLQKRMILLDVGMEGCTACRAMDEITYREPTVVELVSANFVAIQVDAEARPDIGERYSDWAWPATVFMTSEGAQVLALRGNRLPGSFVPILEGLVERQASGTLSVDELAPYGAPSQPAPSDLAQLRDELRQRFDGALARDAFSSASGARIASVFLRAHMSRSDALRVRAIEAAEGYLRMMDDTWGGVFVGVRPDGTPVPEKRISNQAHALNVLAQAYQVTEDNRFAVGIERVYRYLGAQMTAPNGTFFTSQEDRPAALPAAVTTSQYWRLDDVERRAFGLPVTDHAVYTDKNGELISALANAYAATGDRRHVDAAAAAAVTLISTRQTDANWILQTNETAEIRTDRRMRVLATDERPFLAAQAWLGAGLLDLYRVTADAVWLEGAVQLANAMLSTLEDPKGGGFFSTTEDPTSLLLGRRKPLEANARAAHFFYDLAVYTKDPRFAPVAERTIRAAASPRIMRREGRVTGQLALALEKLTAGYVEFSIVGDSRDARAKELFATVRGVYHPRKLAHYEAPGRYPDRGRPTLYICNPDVCSVPIEDPKRVVFHANAMRDPATTPAFNTLAILNQVQHE